MKTLYEVCKPRESVFDESKRDDTLDLSNLLDGSISGKDFFAETYITEGMDLLFETAFKRFEGKAASGLVKLTQAMGGGKTHNMLALGILAQDKNLRKIVLDGKYADFDEDIQVVAYTGRESDIKFGIWGEIAEQLGKSDYFRNHYSPLSAPGQTSWIRLLQSDMPTLILLDELPAYLQDARTKPVGSGNLADVTTTALSNLFNAINKAELSNVCIVVSDLQATYEQGSQLLRTSFRELENEISRSSINIEPVASNTDDLYNILRTRLFEKIGTHADIREIIEDYRKIINEARQMGYTNFTADDLARGIQASYPFHPSLRDLFARFKENPGFQQTRGYIRLTRIMVKDLYTGDVQAKNQYLLNAYDIDLNNSEAVTTVKGIKPSISNAISHDIADGGKSVAESIDRAGNSTDLQDISKLILVSSLGNVSNAIVGLTAQEIIGYIAEPGRDIRGLKESLDEYSTKAWYLYRDKSNKLYFKDIKNVNAALIDLVNGYSYDFGKQTIKKYLEEKFKPEQKDCYQEVLVFPAIDEIDLKRDRITLVLSEPGMDSSGLIDGLRKFYDDISYKNRVMFLTGQRNSMDNLVVKGKEFAAIKSLLNEMKGEKQILESDPEYKQAIDLDAKINLELLSSLRESFVTLYYPKGRGLVRDDITMEFEENHYNLEDQIKNLLIDKMKFDTDINSKEFRGKFEDRIFTQKQMEWNAIKERAATTTSWSWHHPNALEDLKSEMVKRSEWINEGGYINKEPPAPETSLKIREMFENGETGKIMLKLIPYNGDMVYWDIGEGVTSSSAQVKDINNFETDELKLSFLCVDSKDKYPPGDPLIWTRDIRLQYNIFDKEGSQYAALKATPSNVKIRYTTDGSNPKLSGGIYDGEFKIPNGSKYIQAIAINEGHNIESEPLQFEVKERKFEIVPDKSLRLNDPIVYSNNTDTFEGLEELQEFKVKISGIILNITNSKKSNDYVEYSLGEGVKIEDLTIIHNELNKLLYLYFSDKEFEIRLTINTVIFETGKEFERWVSIRKERIDQYKGKITQ